MRTSMKPPPPMFPAAGSTTASAKAVATAASTALPPFSRISTPAREASSSSVVTIPCAARTGSAGQAFSVKARSLYGAAFCAWAPAHQPSQTAEPSSHLITLCFFMANSRYEIRPARSRRGPFRRAKSPPQGKLWHRRPSWQASLSRHIEKPPQASFARERVHGRKKSLQTFEILFSLDGPERFGSFRPAVAPELRNQAGIRRRVFDFDLQKAGFPQQAFILSGRAEQEVSDQTARRDLLMRNDSGNDQGIAEDEPPSRLQHAIEFVQQFRAPGNVAKHVIRKNRVESRFFKR